MNIQIRIYRNHSSDVMPMERLEYPEYHFVASLPVPTSALRKERLLVHDHRRKKQKPRKGSLLFWCRWWDSNTLKGTWSLRSRRPNLRCAQIALSQAINQYQKEKPPIKGGFRNEYPHRIFGNFISEISNGCEIMACGHCEI